LYDIKADKDGDGKSISGSRKEKVINYVNGLDIDYGQKIILFKSEYKSDNTYNYDIVDYLNSRNDISYDEMVTILKELGFIVSSNGYVTW
jgi:CDP-glycerol glycerophosphotransferase (TagB/SpsB family)